MHSLSLSGPHLPEARVRWFDLPGDDERPTRVFVPGPDDAAGYVEAALHPALAGSRTLLVDLPGAGASDRPELFGYTVPEHAATLAALLDHVGVAGVELVGHGTGAAVAIALAGHRPELVGRLVVAGPELASDGFADLKCPRAFLVGGRDRPAGGEAVAKAAGVPIVEVLDAGHDLVADNPAGYPEAVAAALLVAR
ncbi:hypothetical protein Lfu02_56320 [Longispora fulva]|uniref:Pimeloyl-ACP methyl ester carboxylesterase n=1 Tax=Longispora fulva TaxID=619741 RepID=A0A8J7GU64_9ACTN|nr:alpha/beta fold hydrolase [Longispora fulva]MBG6137386.1 pimeloyl-ACP methyl ester carboxylesterase [Longispora fulva]GIG61260.1 hypothetical protein Lfu02_56320 [Longispora fulva]